MPQSEITVDDLHGVFAVPPLPRRQEPRRTIDFDAAERIAAHIEAGGISRYLYGGNAFLFMPLEDLRDAWGPARVLHHATELSGIAATGPIPPFVSPLSDARITRLGSVATGLLEADA